MAQFRRPSRSSPPSTNDPSPDTSLTTSDRSLRSIHSAPSLTSSATLSNSIQSSLNLNVHLIPLPNSHLHVHSESGDDSIEYSDTHDDSKLEDDTIQVLPSANIRITPSTPQDQLRPQPERTDSEQTFAAPQRQPRTSVVSDVYSEDDTMTEESVSGVTDELRRTLFYRPSTDPITVVQSRARAQPEPELELDALLNASTGLSTPDPTLSEPTTPLPSNNEPGPPTRPPRPPSLNLSDADEPKPRPKSVDLVRLGVTGHSRMNSRERLGALFGKGNRSSFGGSRHTSSGRPSLGSGRPSLSAERPDSGGERPSLGGVRPSLGGGGHSHSGSVGTVQPLSIKGKTPAPVTDNERVVEVYQVETGQRPRTISEGSFGRDMDRSVWEDDDTEELGTAWGLVKKWLGDESKASTSLSSAKQKQGQHARKSLSLASTFSAFRTPPTSPGLRDSVLPAGSRDSTLLGLHDSSGPAIRESSVLGLHESSVIGSSSTVANQDWANTSTSRASFQTANLSFQAPSTSFQTAESESHYSQTASFHSAGASTHRPSDQSLGRQSLSASQPSFHSFGTSRRSFQSRRLGPRASVGSSLSSLAEPPESPTVTATRFRSATVSSRPELEEVTERPRSQLLVVPTPESKPLYAEPEPQKSPNRDDNTVTLPSPPSSPSPNSRGLTTTARSLHNPTYPSLHKRLGSLVQHSTPRPSPLRTPASPVRSQAPASPLWSQPSSPRWNQAGPSSPLSSKPPSSPRWSPLYPPSPGALGMFMNMDATYKSDVRPISGVTESTSYYGRGSGAGTAGRPESGATWAGSQRELLLVPPYQQQQQATKTVRIVDYPPEKSSRRILPTPPPSASRVSSIFRVSSPVRLGPRMRRKRYSIEYEAGLSPGKWFALGFVLGPWCWLIGGWMLDGRNRVVGVVGDAEKGVRVEGEQWVRRCRIAAVVSGVCVLACVIAAIVYAVLGAQ